jgi:hypothetical protein
MDLGCRDAKSYRSSRVQVMTYVSVVAELLFRAWALAERL